MPTRCRPASEPHAGVEGVVISTSSEPVRSFIFGCCIGIAKPRHAAFGRCSVKSSSGRRSRSARTEPNASRQNAPSGTA
jgi:hypothetical protein